MADPFSLATGVISLVVVTINIIAGVSIMLDKTIAAHHDADEELERLRCNPEDLQRRMESNYGKLEALASDTKDRGFKKVLQSDAAVVRLCQALKETHSTLKRLTDQTESEEATLRANALPSKKRSLAFVRAVLKYNMSPQMDEMISNLREMQTEIQDCLRNLETAFSNVDDLHDLFHRQLARFSTYSRLSTSTTLTARVQLVTWLGKFGGRRFSKRSRNESLQSFFHADHDEDEPQTAPLSQDASLAEMERLLDAEIKPAPPPLPPKPVPIIVPNTVPLNLNNVNLPVHVEATQRWIPPQTTDFDTGTGGSNVNHDFVPAMDPQTSSGARKPSISSHTQPPVPMCPIPAAIQSDWAIFCAQFGEYQTQVAAVEEELNRDVGPAENNEGLEWVRPPIIEDLIVAPAEYNTVVVASYKPSLPPYAGLDWLDLEVGQRLDVVVDAGPPAAHPEINPVVDDGVDTLFIARRRYREHNHGYSVEVGWVWASYIFPEEDEDQ